MRGASSRNRSGKLESTRLCRLSLAVCAGIGALALTSRAHAGTLYWSAAGTGATGNPPTAGAGGTGQWDNAITSDWWDGSAYQLWDSAAGQDIADFRGTAGTVTINSGETENANQLIFNTTGYVIAGDSTTTLQLNNAGTVTTNTGTATINAPILANNMDVEGSGTLVINNSLNYITGAVTVGPGSTLNVLTPANNFALGASQTLNGGTLLFSAIAGNSIGSTSTGLTVTANSTLQYNNYNSGDTTGAGGSANYYYSILSLGANLNVDAQTNQQWYYYGMPTTYFYGGAILTNNATLNVSGINTNAPTQIATVNLFAGGITGAHTLTKAGNGNLVVGTGGNYSGLAINAGTMSISDAGGFPTASLGFGGGTLNSALPSGTTITIPATTVTGASAFNIDQAPQNTGASTYNLGTLSLGANLSIAENNPGSYYYGQPTINFTGTTLTGNSTLYVNGGTAGGIVTVNMGPITGNYTITKTGNAGLTINTGTGGNYAGLVASAGTVAIGDAGGVPTTSLGLAGGTVTLEALPGVNVSDTTVTTTVSANSTLYMTQPVAAGQYGANGTANYSLGALSLGANLTITQPTPGLFYYGEPKINFGTMTLTTNAVLSDGGGTAGGPIATNLGPIIGAFTLTETGNAAVNILAGSTGNYSGLNISSGTVTINDVHGLPTATLGLSGAALTLYAPSGTTVTNTTVVTTVSTASTININQPATSGAATYNLGALSLGANLTIAQPSNNFYYGEPSLNFGATTLTSNVTLTETGFSNGGGNLTTSVGPITGAFTLTSTGTGSLNIVAGAGGNYSGLAANGGPVTISDSGGFPTATLALGGATLNLTAPSGTTINDTTVATTVSANTTINLTQPGNTGGATYNLGSLSIGADTLVLQLSNPGVYYYGLASLNFGATTLTGNATISTVGANGGFTFNPKIGPVSGGYSLTKTGAANLTLAGSNSYSGNTTVSAGTLIVAVGGSDATPSMNVSSTGMLLVNGILSSGTTLNDSGVTTFAANPTSGTGFRTQPLAGLNVAAGGSVTLANPTAHTDRTVLVVSSGGVTVSSTGTLNIGSNDIIDQGAGTAGLASVTVSITQGYNNGSWNGNGGGITSSTATANTTYLTAIGVILNGSTYGTAVGSLGTFDGVNPGTNDVLIKYTYYGDANLDGAVDGSDYSKIDAGFNSGGTLTGWQNGDFNYDGHIDGSDYTLIDNTFNMQSATLGSNPAELIASNTSQIAGGSSSVPEPAALSLLGFASLSMLGRRTRRRS